MSDTELKVGIETDLSRPMVVGRGNFLVLRGWCFSPRRRIRALEVLVDGTSHPVSQFGHTRRDVLGEHAARDPLGMSLQSGFVAMVPLRVAAGRSRAELRLRAKFRGGHSAEIHVGELALLAEDNAVAAAPLAVQPSSEPLVAIALATHKPPIDLLEVQLESIRVQTHQNWRCIINDDASPDAIWEHIQSLARRDPRFAAFRNPQQLGFYRNFERAIGRVPRDGSVAFVALCDQDDTWYPEKLASCLAAFDRDTKLVYCDMDIVSRDGAKISNTYWTTRRNNYTDFSTLLFANTVTGAASVFRAELLGDLLPFPERIGDSFHDHWIACVAMARGRLGYVDRPLYAYRQHGANVLGHYAPRANRLLPSLGKLRGLLKDRVRAQVQLQSLEDIYQNDVTRLTLIGKTLELRLPEITADRRRVLRRFGRLDRSLVTLFLEGFKYKLCERASLGAEWYCLKGALGHRLLRTYYRVMQQKVAARTRAAAAFAEPVAGSDSAGPIDMIDRKITPLNLKVSPAANRRVNLLIPTIDFRYFFGGYIAKFNLALMLRRRGFAVRMVTVDYCQPDPDGWRRRIQDFHGLESFFDEVEVVHAYDRSHPLDVNPADSFIATTWWTAHLAHRVVGELGRERFVYLIQEYEPMTYAMGSYFALADQSYTLPHEALFSTELLRDHFREHRLGVFAAGSAEGEAHSMSFRNAINSFEVTLENLQRHSGHRLLFYARPEPHAARNMFELGALSIRRAVQRGLLEGWELHGIGSVGSARVLELGDGVRLRNLPRVGLEEYLGLLPTYDLGVALMLTPHPSLLPLEMAAAGLVTVTNTCGVKTADRLRALSSNILGVPPTIEGVVQGIAEATQRVADLPGRVTGSRVDWPTSWSTVFDDAFRERLRDLLDSCRPGVVAVER
jgi:glycosyltransferase involved in cell wall biosynthesis